MSAELKETNVQENKDVNFYRNQSKIKSNKVNLNDLVSRMKSEEKQEKKNNILLSCAAISAVAVFGVLLTL